VDRRNRERDPQGFTGVVGFTGDHRVYEVSLDLEITHLDVGPSGEFGLYLDVANSERWGEGTVTGSWPPVVPELDDQMYFGRVDMTPQEAWLHATPGGLHFEAVAEQAAPAPAALTVVELLGGAVSFTAGTSQSWLQVTPVSGQTPQALAVTVDHAGLEPGTYAGEVVLESTQTGNSRHTVPVTLDVLPTLARLAVDPASFDVTVTEGDPDPTRDLVVSNLGGRDMAVTLAPSEAWISTAASFTVPPGESLTIPVKLILTGLAPGAHPAEILVAAPEALDSPVTVAVNLEVQMANTAPPAPVLLAPENGSELYGSVDLMAYPVEDPQGDPVTYHFELMVSATNDPVDSGTGTLNSGFVSWQPAAQLKENTLYRWRVKAADDRGAESGYSEERTFLIVAEPASDDCGCSHTSAPSAGFLLFLLGLATLRKRTGTG
jgi:MYXO-CTERM domain-containing protein